jgi:serine/threonine protein kinase
MELHFGNYTVTEELGSGGIALVYKAMQEPLGRAIAIKALKPTIGPESPFAAQLEREARLLGDLSHPNIVLLHDFVKTSEQMYLVLEFVDGFSLAELLAKRTRLAPEAVAQIGAEIARGLAHAHERGIVHRDVKPANVLLSRRGEVKLVDFGIAQRERLPTADEPLGREEKGENMAFGTPAYMSPEQILGEFVDARSDIFSLGVVLYELLCGARPFDKGEKRAAAQRIRRDPPTPLRSRAPEVPRALDRIVMRSLEKLPADRFSSALGMADLLDDFVRSRVRGSRPKLITRALTKARLLSDHLDESVAAVLQDQQSTLRPVLFGFATIATLVISGGAAIQLTARSSHDAIGGVGGPLQLVPARVGFLRAVATPWADVVVDGQHIDTTPFARAIPLAAGTHYVTFNHPSARAEKRVVRIEPGESTLLDVTMDLGFAGDGGKEGGT